MQENNKQLAGQILLKLREHKYTQRELKDLLSLSIGMVNRHIKQLEGAGLIDSEGQLTAAGQSFLANSRPRNAIILAAGFGMRMIPLNIETPKGLLEVKGERLIERLIRQLQTRGISDITLVVGHLKESYEYLIDQYQVKLVTNPDYATTNSLASLALVRQKVTDSYLLPCDLYFEDNPFRHYEFSSWYAITNGLTKHSSLLVNNRLALCNKKKQKMGNHMLGLAFIHHDDSNEIQKLLDIGDLEDYDDLFWEDRLEHQGKFLLPARLFRQDEVSEFNSIKDLRKFETGQLERDPILNIISEQLHVSIDSIRSIKPLKHGMTNRSFDFVQGDQAYIMRIPGEGTEKLMNRRQEAEVNRILQQNGLAQELIFFNAETGHKISKKLCSARNCAADNDWEVAQAMQLLNDFHQLRLQVSHRFDLFGEIERYDRLCGDAKSMFSDYCTTKANIMSLQPIIEYLQEPLQLCHIDAVPDNFIFYLDSDGSEQLTMIDWEYAGLQERYVDIAMFGIYAGYDERDFERLIDYYLQAEALKMPEIYDQPCPQLPYFSQAEVIRLKVYAYAAIAGLLWSNWCEYKRLLGVDFGEYTLVQYRYAKHYFRKIIEHPILKNVQLLLSKQNSEKNGEPVTRAIIMAAGRGERLRPLTDETPKPLIVVQDQPMVERLISQLNDQGIREIHIVTGYLADRFSYLADKFPGVELHYNPYYDNCNNISSLYCVRDILASGPVVILDGDQIINDIDCLRAKVVKSEYCCFYTTATTEEWLLDWDGEVRGCRIGGSAGWQLKSVSFWCSQDARQLAKDVEELFLAGKTDLYWDNIALFEKATNYHLDIRPISAEAITEIDSYDEYLAVTNQC